MEEFSRDCISYFIYLSQFAETVSDAYYSTPLLQMAHETMLNTPEKPSSLLEIRFLVRGKNRANSVGSDFCGQKVARDSLTSIFRLLPWIFSF
jgi:hypothetical protein